MAKPNISILPLNVITHLRLSTVVCPLQNWSIPSYMPWTFPKTGYQLCCLLRKLPKHAYKKSKKLHFRGVVFHLHLRLSHQRGGDFPKGFLIRGEGIFQKAGKNLNSKTFLQKSIVHADELQTATLFSMIMLSLIHLQTTCRRLVDV